MRFLYFCTIFIILLHKGFCDSNVDAAGERFVEIAMESSDIEDNFDDPCIDMHCTPGRECVIDPDTKKAKCDCVKECGYQPDPRRKVCTNQNETFPTGCEFHQLRCFCEDGTFEKCSNPEKYQHTHIEYYGECRMIPECTLEELVDFPRRMREWLFNVMDELSERSELSNYYQTLQKEAKQMDEQKRWTNAAIWKWCDLDSHPHDNSVSRHELFPVKAPLQALEHCIGHFLEICDKNDDHGITLKEWTECLELEEHDFMAKCEEL
jgi:hypothetical protein